MTTAIYTRVSTEEQVREGMSLEVQEQRCREAVAQGEPVVFCDDGYSGGSMKRPALQRLMASLDELDAVYVWKLDRLSRSVRDCSNILHEFAKRDIGIYSVSEGFDFTTAAGNVMMNMLASFGQFFREATSENVKATLIARAKRGLPHGARPFGYDKQHDTLTILPDEADVVRQIYELYLNGYGLHSICQTLNEQGFKTRDGNEWHYNTVKHIIRNPVYKGCVHHNGDVYPGKHTAIIDAQTFDQAQQILKNNQWVHPKARHRTLSPLLTCGVCGGNICSADLVYFCRARKDQPVSTRHPAVVTYRAKVEAVIWRYVQTHINNGRLQDIQGQFATHQEINSKTLRRATDDLARVRGDLTYNLETAREGAIDAELLAETNRPLLQRKRFIQRQIDQLEEHLQKQKPPQVRVGKLRRANYGKQRIVLEQLFESIELHRGYLVFHSCLPGMNSTRVKMPDYWRKAWPLSRMELEVTSPA